MWLVVIHDTMVLSYQEAGGALLDAEGCLEQGWPAKSFVWFWQGNHRPNLKFTKSVEG